MNVTVCGLRAKVKSTDGVTTKALVVYLAGASNITFRNCIIDRLDTNWLGTSWKIYKSFNINFDNCFVLAANSPALGDSYAFLLDNSSFCSFYKSGYVDGNNTAKSGRGYVARHGSHISFDSCLFAGVDDHYGQDYYINNMIFNGRGIGWSGGNLTVRNSSAFGAGSVLVYLRADTPFAEGKLIIDGCYTNETLLSSERYSDARQTKRKVWDEIVIANTTCENVTTGKSSILITGFLPTDAISKTKKLLFSNVTFTRKTANIASCFFYGSQDANDGGTTYRWVSNVSIKDSDFTNQIAGDGTYGKKYVALLRLNAEFLSISGSKGIAFDICDIGVTEIIGSYLGGTDAYGLGFMNNSGPVTVANSEIDTFFAPSASANAFVVSLIGCLISKNIFAGGAALATKAGFMSGNRAKIGVSLTGAPGSILNYTNPTYFVTN